MLPKRCVMSHNSFRSISVMPTQGQSLATAFAIGPGSRKPTVYPSDSLAGSPKPPGGDEILPAGPFLRSPGKGRRRETDDAVWAPKH